MPRLGSLLRKKKDLWSNTKSNCETRVCCRSLKCWCATTWTALCRNTSWSKPKIFLTCQTTATSSPKSSETWPKTYSASSSPMPQRRVTLTGCSRPKTTTLSSCTTSPHSAIQTPPQRQSQVQHQVQVRPTKVCDGCFRQCPKSAIFPAQSHLTVFLYICSNLYVRLYVHGTQ